MAENRIDPGFGISAIESMMIIALDLAETITIEKAVSLRTVALADKAIEKDVHAFAETYLEVAWENQRR